MWQFQPYIAYQVTVINDVFYYYSYALIALNWNIVVWELFDHVLLLLVQPQMLKAVMKWGVGVQKLKSRGHQEIQKPFVDAP